LVQKILDLKDFISNLFNSIIAICKVIAFSKFKVTNHKTNSRSCVILGNGPSLNDSLQNHLEFIKKHDIFCVNVFSASTYYKQLKPNNYLLLDNAFTEPNHERASKAIVHLVDDTDWELNLFVPFKFKKSSYFVESIAKNPNIKVIYFNYVILDGLDSLKFWFYKNELGMPQSQNVLVASIFRCINLKYKEIYVLGADHTWHETIRLNDDNEIVADDSHFYGTKTYEINKLMPKNKSYMARQFLSLHKAFKGYEVLARYAEYRKVDVINASKRSYIDVFRKIKL
jgi:hypothetical protein